VGIQHKFHQLFIASGKLDVNLSRILVALFQSRQEADYAFEASFTIENARDAVKNAGVHFRLVDQRLLNHANQELNTLISIMSSRP
jgi:uncharacterized protein (UPF0332 family)